MKIGFLGAGTWGTALYNLLSKEGYEIIVWNRNKELLKILDEKREHPKLSGYEISKDIVFEESFEKVIKESDIIIESVTSSGIRKVLTDIKSILKDEMKPFVFTSKGIEQKTGLLFPEIALEIWGKENRDKICALSGPSHAEEVIRNLPTSVVIAAFDKELLTKMLKIFNAPNFRVYPNLDILGVCFGGAMKNIIAIACAISDGLGFGDNTKAALLTRGLHEIRKIAEISKGANKETLNGLSGLGDLFVTCGSTLSRNYRFGRLIAEGYSIEDAKEKIGMVVEGVYTCLSAKELGEKYNVPLPITNATYKVLYESMSPKKAVTALLERKVKHEHL